MDAMPSDTLTTIAEVAIALAGFASVVVALQRRFDDAGSVHHAQLWRLLEASLATTAFALLPIVLENAGLYDAVWQVTSLGLACWGATTTALVLHRHRRRLAIDKSLWRFNGPMLAVCLLRSVPFGKYCRSRPFVFSFVPRCHGLWGSQK